MAGQIRLWRPIGLSVINVKTLSFDNDWIQCLKKKNKKKKTKTKQKTPHMHMDLIASGIC